MIKCKICHQEFDNVIGWKHLKKHNITTAQYKLQYGQVASDEYRQRRSRMSTGKHNPMFGKKWQWSDEQKDNIKGRVPHNIGQPMSDNQKEILSQKAIARNNHWKYTNTHPTAGKTYDELHGAGVAQLIKDKLSNANLGKSRSTESIAKSLATKQSNGYVTSGMKGKTHTPETRAKMSAASTIAGKIKREKSISKKIQMLDTINYTLIAIDGTLLTLQCDKGHEFNRTSQILTTSKFKENLCPVCHPPTSVWTSVAENEIAEYMATFAAPVLRSVRSVITGELDIYLPNHNLAIEFNGLYWHNETFKTKDYHLRKTTDCENKGIQLIHIFEDEWANNANIVKSRLSGILGQNKKIFARKCTVSEISSKVSNAFLKENHIQGHGRANIHIGLFYDNELMSVMTFLNGDISKKVTGWELNRFCSKQFTNIVGGASKLFKYFTKTYLPEKITTFADRRWSSNKKNVYDVLGFVEMQVSPPNYWYVMPNQIKRYHRFALRKPVGAILSEREIRDQQGWSRIWDCGNLKYCWEA